MLVLDTNHITALGYTSPLSTRLHQRLTEANQDTATTIITVEEQLRGWLSEIRKLTDPHDQIFAYSELQNRVTLFAAWMVLPWDVEIAGPSSVSESFCPAPARSTLKLPASASRMILGFSPATCPISAKCPACALRTGLIEKEG